MQFSTSEQCHFIDGPEGKLELLLAPGQEPQRDIIAVICHPLPTEGGTMTNKVVTTLHRVCRDLGVPSVRFNFRGVGDSDGKFDAGEGEVEDLMAVLNWLKQSYPEASYWLMGFSFGSYVAAKGATRWPCERLVSVAPPVHHYDYPAKAQITCPWIVIQGDADEVVPSHDVYDWIEHANSSAHLIRFPEIGHFFHGHLIPLRDALKNLLVKLDDDAL